MKNVLINLGIVKVFPCSLDLLVCLSSEVFCGALWVSSPALLLRGTMYSPVSGINTPPACSMLLQRKNTKENFGRKDDYDRWREGNGGMK